MRNKAKLAPTPPAVRAPVFPHAFPVTEGLKLAIPLAEEGKSDPPQIYVENALPRPPFCHDAVYNL
jgi:hypothetical protein